jgi:hypothetical protein
MMLGPFHETAIKALGKEEFVFLDHYFVQDGGRVLVGKLPREGGREEWVIHNIDEHACQPCKTMHGKTLSELPLGEPPISCCENILHKCRCVARKKIGG